MHACGMVLTDNLFTTIEGSVIEYRSPGMPKEVSLERRLKAPLTSRVITMGCLPVSNAHSMTEREPLKHKIHEYNLLVCDEVILIKETLNVISNDSFKKFA